MADQEQPRPSAVEQLPDGYKAVWVEARNEAEQCPSICGVHRCQWTAGHPVGPAIGHGVDYGDLVVRWPDDGSEAK